jgi:hypothetical protein
MRNYNIDHPKRDKAINMFLAGAKKEVICRKIGVSESIFDIWVDGNDFKEFRIKTAFNMFCNYVPEDKICRKLSIDIAKLHEWVSECYKKEHEAAISMKQYKGVVHPWVTEICKSAIH